MLRLYHWPLDPAGRMVRLVLAEKGEPFEAVSSRPWAPELEIASIAPGAVAPALVSTHGTTPRFAASGTRAICEHLEEIRPVPSLLPDDPTERAEARRLWSWVEAGMEEVTDTLLSERVIQWTHRGRQPDSEKLRRGAHALRGRLTFLNALAEQRGNLAGRHLSLADFAAAAHLSAYDYFGDVQWEAVPDLKAWYMRIKSRPSFRPILADRLEAARPVSYYAELDF
ncbi:glutathione S-transferase [Hyphomonas neptunium ATCC 15444]|uniref:Glutathione S-transferase n=2 Tax=Hyphomonas TaxID=85 RepID=Q0BXL3_HYPNA|nr:MULTISPECIES: glutathione S-transferase family protein [Hyphomonas]ABI77513.1 glutathione S-transferase [Hyphomonas neptunium ATCC 15444]KCZ89890.1 glutathione S-transferase [Hyphomonas hirschiana VP5]